MASKAKLENRSGRRLHGYNLRSAFSYQDAVRSAVKSLSKAGIDAIIYPSGHTDKMDVAVRRAVLTGVNQTAARIQTARADEMECDLVETTAHMGARPEHMDWQGRIFSRSGKSRKYPDFVKSTGYGTGPGLCGWNCRHSFFPYFEGLSERAYSRAKLREYENKTVTYNGRTLPYYDATQQQRYLERQIRRWKREYLAMDAAVLDTSDRPAPGWLPGGRSKRDLFTDPDRSAGEDKFGARSTGFGSQAARARAQAERLKSIAVMA
ncbi:MAG: phage minor capsid protein [Oscillospiraceae bacterium]